MDDSSEQVLLEAVLLDYVERFGLTEKARAFYIKKAGDRGDLRNSAETREVLRMLGMANRTEQ